MAWTKQFFTQGAHDACYSTPIAIQDVCNVMNHDQFLSSQLQLGVMILLGPPLLMLKEKPWNRVWMISMFGQYLPILACTINGHLQ